MIPTYRLLSLVMEHELMGIIRHGMKIIE
jgi:hypothetical protein